MIGFSEMSKINKNVTLNPAWFFVVAQKKEKGHREIEIDFYSQGKRW